MTNQIGLGDIYWLKIDSEFKHPDVVIDMQNNSVMVCAITTNMNKLSLPGNVILESGEGNLQKQSIVEVAKQYTVDESQLGEYIGYLSQERVKEIKEGIGFINRTYFNKA
jgi:mRNA interferase MazF